MRARSGRTLHVFSAACVALALALGTGLAARAEAVRPIPVVASFSIVADWVRVIGGESVDVLSLVPRDADSHVFRPTPRHVRAVAAARLIVVNGLGFEGWLQRLLSAADPHAPIVEASAGIDGLRLGESDLSTRKTFDPHAWHSVPNAIVYVRNITEALCAVDAPGCDDYRARAHAYVEKLRALDSELRARFGAVPPGRRTVVTSHDAFGYLAREYGVEFLAVQGASTDTEAAAGHVAALITEARRRHLPMFLENVANPRLLQQIGRETGHDPNVRLYSDALSQPDGPAGTYVAMMRYNTNALVSAMLDE